MSQALLGFDPANPGRGGSAELVFHVDGGSRGNPGPAGYGAMVRDPAGATIAELSEFIGIATNNVAEYRGLLAALEYAKAHQARGVKVYCDSELVVRQMQGVYKVKSPDLKPIFDQVKRLASGFPRFSIHHVPRERNADADRLANLAMDRARSGGFGQIATTPAAPLRPLSRPIANAPEPVISFFAVAEAGCLRPVAPLPALEEGQDYEVSIRRRK